MHLDQSGVLSAQRLLPATDQANPLSEKRLHRIYDVVGADSCGVEEFSRLYVVAGFEEVRAQLLPRPTPLPGGIAGWVKTFRAGLLDVAMVPEWERDDIAAAIEARVAPALRTADGTFCADYVRLRFAMRRPE